MRPPRLPSSIKIGAHDYRLTRLPAKEESKIHGDCDDDLLVIRMARRNRRSKSQEMLLHEITHALFYATPIDWQDIDEERIVTMLAPKILQVLRDNPALVAFLTHK